MQRLKQFLMHNPTKANTDEEHPLLNIDEKQIETANKTLSANLATLKKALANLEAIIGEDDDNSALARIRELYDASDEVIHASILIPTLCIFNNYLDQLESIKIYFDSTCPCADPTFMKRFNESKEAQLSIISDKLIDYTWDRELIKKVIKIHMGEVSSTKTMKSF